MWESWGPIRAPPSLWAPHSLSVHSPCWLQLEGPQSSSLHAAPCQKWLVHSQWPSTQVPCPLQSGGWQRGSCTHTTVDTRRGQRHMLSWLWGIHCEERPWPWCWFQLAFQVPAPACLHWHSDARAHACMCLCVHAKEMWVCAYGVRTIRDPPFKFLFSLSLAWTLPNRLGRLARTSGSTSLFLHNTGIASVCHSQLAFYREMNSDPLLARQVLFLLSYSYSLLGPCIGSAHCIHCVFWRRHLQTLASHFLSSYLLSLRRLFLTTVPGF